MARCLRSSRRLKSTRRTTRRDPSPAALLCAVHLAATPACTPGCPALMHCRTCSPVTARRHTMALSCACFAIMIVNASARRRAALSQADAVERVADGLAYLHSKGIAHRDLKARRRRLLVLFVLLASISDCNAGLPRGPAALSSSSGHRPLACVPGYYYNSTMALCRSGALYGAAH